jgi:hypothetical protein
MIDKCDEPERITTRKLAAKMGVSQSYAYKLLVERYGKWGKIGKTQKLSPQQKRQRVFLTKIKLRGLLV